ncbi:MAG TPA: GAF domain-containing protein [Thermoanaerobaculia bacterium]
MVEGRKVLLLESDAAAMFPLSSGLRKNGWAVVGAMDAAQAMQIGRQQKPDAVVVNAQLAGGGGIVALQRLRSSAYTANIPAICITRPNSRERDEFAAAGALEMVDPPGDPGMISAALGRALNRPQALHLVPKEVLAAPPRVAALAESGLLDGPVEPAFDELTRLAATLLNTPLALVSVVDTDRQFFKSQFGLGEPLKSARQTPLSHSFCQWVVGGNEELVVDDARSHPVLATNLAVRDFGVTAYAGVPFRTNEQALGSFCAVDVTPRSWTEEDLATLRDLSSVVEAYVAEKHGALDPAARLAATGNAVIGATRVLVRGLPRCGPGERTALARIAEEQSRRMVRLAAS